MTSINEALKQNVEAAWKELESIVSEDAYNPDEEMEISVGDWLMDALDIDYRVASDGVCVGCRVWVTLGGPSVWLDTEDASFHGAWGGEKYTLPIPYAVAQDVQEYAWNCRGCFLD